MDPVCKILVSISEELLLIFLTSPLLVDRSRFPVKALDPKGPFNKLAWLGRSIPSDFTSANSPLPKNLSGNSLDSGDNGGEVSGEARLKTAGLS